jgi:hypothetical protein
VSGGDGMGVSCERAQPGAEVVGYYLTLMGTML